MAGGALANVEPSTILQAYESGKTITQIANSLGLKGGEQIYRFLIASVPEQWKQYQTAKSLRRLEEATEEMETAPDALSLARSRERVKAAQWELERLCRRIYGQDTVPSTYQPVQININLRAAAQRSTAAIEHDAGNDVGANKESRG